MPRNHPPVGEPAAPAIHVIDPNGVYGVDDAIRIFRLRKSTIRREIREGRLRVSKRSGRYFLLGKWLIEWIEEGELKRPGSGSHNGGQSAKESP
jgi:hypothetical protein